MSKKPQLWVVVGATGTGKTRFSLDLAEALIAHGHTCEIVNADAMQLYRGMDIGTAKIPVAERRGIEHHLLDVLSVADDAAVAWYQRHARDRIEKIHRRGAHAIIVGGSGLYVSGVIYDFHFPARNTELRAQIEHEYETHGAAALFEEIRSHDPETAARLDPRNERRIVRAVEVLRAGGDTHAKLPDHPDLWRPQTTIIGLDRPRDQLVPVLDHRVVSMWRAGLLDEVTALRAEGLERGNTARHAIGYAQALAYLDGELSKEKAIDRAQALTRQYARRQVSWFRRYPTVRWVPTGTSVTEVIGID